MFLKPISVREVLGCANLSLLWLSEPADTRGGGEADGSSDEQVVRLLVLLDSLPGL
jgi:hypothetical protein